MHEMKKGTLKSGRSGKKVTNPKQAIAIGLSEARKKGAKVPGKEELSLSAKRQRRPSSAAALLYDYVILTLACRGVGPASRQTYRSALTLEPPCTGPSICAISTFDAVFGLKIGA